MWLFCTQFMCSLFIFQFIHCISLEDLKLNGLHQMYIYEWEVLNWKCAFLDQTCFYMQSFQTSISVTFIYLCVAATISLAKVLLYHKLQSSAREDEFTHLHISLEHLCKPRKSSPTLKCLIISWQKAQYEGLTIPVLLNEMTAGDSESLQYNGHLIKRNRGCVCRIGCSK